MYLRLVFWLACQRTILIVNIKPLNKSLMSLLLALGHPHDPCDAIPRCNSCSKGDSRVKCAKCLEGYVLNDDCTECYRKYCLEVIISSRETFNLYLIVLHSQKRYSFWEWRSHSELAAMGFSFSNENKMLNENANPTPMKYFSDEKQITYFLTQNDVAIPVHFSVVCNIIYQ